MADKILNVRVKHKYDTEANWKNKNPVLLQGEIGFINDGRYKVGNGTSKWNDLQYATTDSLVGHVSGEGFGYGYAYSKTITIPKTTAATTYYIQIAKDASFRFKNYYIKTNGNNTQYSFKAEISANAYMDPHITLNSQLYNTSEIKSILICRGDNYTHNIFLVIDSSTSIAKTIYIQSDNVILDTVSTTAPTTTTELTANIVNDSYIYTSKKIVANITGSASSVPWNGITGKPSTFTPSSHTHDDRYYTESEVESKLSAKSNNGHTHDDRYYTEAEINSKLSGKSDTNHSHNLSTMINGLDSGTATPSDSDYYISQWAGGGTSNTSAVRRSHSALWQYIKGKADSIYAKVTHSHKISEITDIGNASVNYANSAGSAKTATTAGTCTGNSATATSAVDYNDTSAKINIGYSGTGISRDDIKYIAGYTTGTNGASANIKDISKDALKSWLGLGSLAYSSATIPTIPSSLPANGGNASTVNGHTVNTDVPSGAVFTDTNTWRPLGTTADTACAGNDARLSNARPASDVYSWAKASSKPSYSWGEITGKPSTFEPSSHTHSSLRAKVGAIPTTFSQSNDHSLTYSYLNNTDDKYVYITMKSQKTYATQIRAYASIIEVRTLSDKASNWDSIVTSSSLKSTLTSASVKYATTSGSANSVAWGNVSGKPSTFTPSSHSHAISDITNLQSTLDGKAASSHSHSNYVTWTNKIFDDAVTLKDASGIYWKTNANASITALSMLNSDGSKSDKSGMVISADTVQLTTSDVMKVMGTFTSSGYDGEIIYNMDTSSIEAAWDSWEEEDLPAVG